MSSVYKEGTEKYLFADIGVKSICLICYVTDAVLKEYNLKRHFETNHTDLVKSLKQQQTVLEKISASQRNPTKASFVLANKISMQNKSFVETDMGSDQWVCDFVFVVDIMQKMNENASCRTSIIRQV